MLDELNEKKQEYAILEISEFSHNALQFGTADLQPRMSYIENARKNKLFLIKFFTFSTSQMSHI